MATLFEYLGLIPHRQVRELVIDELLRPLEKDWPQAMLASLEVLDRGGSPAQAGETLNRMMRARVDQIQAAIRAEFEQERKEVSSENYDQRQKISELEVQLKDKESERKKSEGEIETLKKQTQELRQTIHNQNKIIADQHYRLAGLFGAADDPSRDEVH